MEVKCDLDDQSDVSGVSSSGHQVVVLSLDLLPIKFWSCFKMIMRFRILIVDPDLNPGPLPVWRLSEVSVDHVQLQLLFSS